MKAQLKFDYYRAIPRLKGERERERERERECVCVCVCEIKIGEDLT